MWDEEARKNLLENNDIFLSRYCSLDGSSATLNLLGDRVNDSDFISDLRNVIIKITMLMPQSAHKSVKHTGDEFPIIVTGNNAHNLSLRIGIGLAKPKSKIFDKKNPNKLWIYSGDEYINQETLPGKCSLWKFEENAKLTKNCIKIVKNGIELNVLEILDEPDIKDFLKKLDSNHHDKVLYPKYLAGECEHFKK